MNRFRLVSFLILITMSCSLIAQNPFFSGGGKRDTSRTIEMPGRQQESDGKASIVAMCKYKLTAIQRDLRDALYQQKERAGSLAGKLYALLLVFIYGFIHALGPGHGKVFISTFSLSSGIKTMRAVLGGALVGMLHGIAALLLVVLLRLILKLPVTRSSELIRSHVEVVAFVILLIIGIVLLIRSIGAKYHEHSRASFWGLVLSIGLVPCPGAVMITLYGFSVLQNPVFTVVMVLTMGMGMSLAISLFALVPSLLRNAGFLANRNVWKGLSIGGAILIILFSSLYLIALL